MKKRLIISNLLILFLSLIAMLIGSNIIATKSIESSAGNEIKNYLSIALNVYDGHNKSETANIITKNNEHIRITFIDSSTYEVLYDDGYDVDEYENHSNRPELLHPGSIQIRKSTTMNVKMMYIAAMDGNEFVRISIPLSNLSSLKNTYMIYASIIWFIIALISTITTIFLNKISLKPINKELHKLASIVDSSSAEVDIDQLPTQVDKTRSLIESKIKAITQEKEKLNYVINSINQGFVVVDEELDVYLVNDKAINIFNSKETEILQKNFIYLCHDEYLLNDIKKSLTSKITFSAEHKIEKKSYLVTLSYLDDIWNYGESKCGVAIFIMDMNAVSQVEMMKKDFFANASHELKSPLTTIIGNMQMISEEIVTDRDELHELVVKSEKEAKRMAKIITEMLELSYLEMGEKTDLQDVECTSVIHSIIEKFEFQIKEKNLSITLDIEKTMLKVNLSDIQYLISNLVDNAIKYNKVNGNITISLKNDVFTIKDSGIGISNENIDRIFERFYRVDLSRSRDLGGTGLGLSIVKHICNKYHFELSVDSILDVGTTFTIVFNKK